VSAERTGVDSASVVLLSLALVVGVVELIYKPFLFGPIAFAAMLVGATMSARYQRFGRVAMFVLVFFFMFGVSYAVWNSRALY
jgi:hypothetical protein